MYTIIRYKIKCVIVLCRLNSLSLLVSRNIKISYQEKFYFFNALSTFFSDLLCTITENKVL